MLCVTQRMQPVPHSPLILPGQTEGLLLRRRFLARAGALAISCGSLPLFAQGDEGPQVFKPESVQTDAVATPAPAADLSRGLNLESISQNFWDRPRELRIYRRDTHETLKAVYWRDGRIDADGYWKICALLRDVHQNIMTTMDPALLDVLRGILGYYEQWNWPHPLVILSGFRTVKTNSALTAEGAARNSLHLYGRAADVYMPGVPTRDLARLGTYFQRGGVGFYPDNGFVHLDTGPVRAWVKHKPRK